MKPWTVAWDVAAYDDLAVAWAAATDRTAVSDAARRIDETLSRKPGTCGAELHEGLRVVAIGPLRVTFEVRDERGRVDVLRLRLAERVQNNDTPLDGA